MKPLEFVLPYPPSVNHYWHNRVAARTTRGGRRRYVVATHVGPEGKKFRARAKLLVRKQGRIEPLEGEVFLSVGLVPPDNRRRDIDNPLKALLDALVHAGVFVDDSQVAELSVERFAPSKPGRVVVRVETIDPQLRDEDREIIAEALAAARKGWA